MCSIGSGWTIRSFQMRLPFWQQAYTNLVRWIIELHRLFPGAGSRFGTSTAARLGLHAALALAAAIYGVACAAGLADLGPPGRSRLYKETVSRCG